ncbi:PEP-CTERM sorting domain-containing protein [uncultured Akkermansia sp.]|uniref:PEP-CTERM sorting domain-containing protein n=1 Tax=uncultured Akkermansia sp. TaxID=512294 RepID=UPI00265C9CA4|nr:PEP-CTERM sorting domain-containing protein [uncultured Akkermansia sp.]
MGDIGLYKNYSCEYYVDGVYGLSTNVEGFLQMIPEPGTATLSLTALLCLAWRRRRLESC